MHKPAQHADNKNMVVFVLAMVVILFCWQHFYEGPRMQAIQAQQAKEQADKAKNAPAPAPVKTQEATVADTVANSAPRIRINTPSLHGSISTVGGRFDDEHRARLP